jgi:hypothetical protein
MVRLVCVMALGAIGFGFQSEATLSNRDRETDVYKIYSLLMTNPRTSHGSDNNPRYLIGDTTRPGFGQPCVQPPRDRQNEFQEVLADFENRKRTPRRLTRQFSIRKPYELLTAEEVKAFQVEREPRPDRETSGGRFTGVTDVFILGDVYFSNNAKLALTAVSTWCGGLCGQHAWKVLEKLPTGAWQEQPWITCFTIAAVAPIEAEVK